MSKRRVYVTQYGTTWSLSPAAWRQAVEHGVAGDAFSYDHLGRQLSRQLTKWDAQHKPLDWRAEDWAYQLEVLNKEQTK